MTGERAPIGVKGLITDDWRIHGSIYRAPHIFSLEVDGIFRSCWLYLAHESELGGPGDFKTTYAGTQPVIVTRDAGDGTIHAFLNRCRHRGSIVCREEQGTARSFRCPYHGWTYSNSGDLQGISYQAGYQGLDRDELGLVKLPRVEQFAGFIFGTLSPDGPSLEAYLGNARPYLEIVSEQGKAGIELSAGAHRSVYEANWKLQVENTIDNYHFAFVHRSFLETLADRLGEPPPIERNIVGNPDWRTKDLGGGHSVHEFGDPRTGGNQGQLGDLPFNLIVFPNLCFVGAQLRLILPKRVDRTEVVVYPMLHAGESAASNAAILRAHEGFYGPAGFGAPDDIDVAFDRVQQGLEAIENDWLVMSRGAHREAPEGHGVLVGHAADELPQRAFYRQWLRQLETVS